uniref:Rad60/SUMO-like domain-containing protein n=1 Tax=Cyclopterus lumpus TaxID=8103 RepID=A0A8C2WCI3_CYCLU
SAWSCRRRTVRFLFDGCSVASGQTPAQLDMEDGDIIEFTQIQHGGAAELSSLK